MNRETAWHWRTLEQPIRGSHNDTGLSIVQAPISQRLTPAILFFGKSSTISSKSHSRLGYRDIMLF
jgi:hypothetical protein